MEIKPEYYIYKIIETNFGDPISSMYLTPDYIIFGTMLGQISLFTFSSKHLSLISEVNPENISNISYNSEDNIINISIGDEKILRYKEDKYNPKNFLLFQKVLNYSNDIDHSKYCENAFIYLSSHYLFRIQLSQPEEKCLNIIEMETEYEIMNINNNDVFYIGRLPMTNYIVPFCFDGEYFAWVEFTGPNKRNLCLANVIKNFLQNINSNLITPLKKEIDESFGHISHLKILGKTKIFLIRSLNTCEIRQINNDFTLLESFQHIGDEVYAVDIFYNNEFLRNRDNEKESSNFNFLIDNNINIDKINLKDDDNENVNKEENKKSIINGKNNDETISKNDKEIEYNYNEDKPIEKSKTEIISQKIKQNNNDKKEDKNKLFVNFDNNSGNSEYKKSLQNNFENNEKNKKENSKDNKYDYDIDSFFSIITLDIDGNINLYHQGKENTLFNLYNFKEISQKMKDDQFFSIGYEYYIKSNLNYFCISTDHGCFIVKKNL